MADGLDAQAEASAAHAAAEAMSENMLLSGEVRALETALRESTHHAGARPSYAGRAASASTATGDKTIHKREVKKLYEDAFK